MFCIINKNLTKIISEIKTIDNVEIIEVDFTDDLFLDLTKIGLKIEEILLERRLIWGNKPLPGILIVWDHVSIDRIVELSSKIDNLRGDEILIPNYIGGRHVAGHPRAIVKWCSSIRMIKNIINIRSLRDEDTVHKIFWWAHRLDLRLYHIQ
jgi:hypothetical protein